MLALESNKGVRFCDGLSRRDFLQVGALGAGAVGLSLADCAKLDAAGAARANDMHCIVLFLVGGPSHLDTWDPKPSAPDNVRGPFRAIQTNVPGVQVCETFALMAQRANRYAIVRSVHHRAAPIHETGHQLMQTGRLCQSGLEQPHYGAVVSQMRGPRQTGMPPFMVVPAPIGNTGVSISHGQGAGYLGARHEPFAPKCDFSVSGFRVADLCTPAGLDPARLQNRKALLDAVDAAQRAYDAEGYTPRDSAHEGAFNLVFSQQARRAFDVAAESDERRSRYGRNTFGQSCLLARRLVEHGVRLVTVNMFDTVFNNITWDCHADGGALGVTLNDYRDTLCPMFDRAYSALLDDLNERGMLDNTLVVAMGEFGRTPLLNSRGGRDHWPGVWSILFAGGRVRGGQVIGSSDRTGAEPRDRPVSPAQVAATVYRGLGIDLGARLPGPDNRLLSITDAQPIDELFR
ncbi:MAG: DUF1501 domain-containing protein [Gemmataceae bacterium]|nr:DUF1501 domain-containing protein [Gemmataceae bacterium]